MQSSMYSFSSRSLSFLRSQFTLSSCSEGSSTNALIPVHVDNRLISSSHYSVSISSQVSESIGSSLISSSSQLNSEILISPSILFKQIYLQEFVTSMDWRNKPNQIFNKVKQQMYGKGVETFHYVDQFISQFDPNFSKVLSSHFFNLFLNKIGVFLTTQEIRNVRDLYGKSKDEDFILYIDFLQDVKYSLSEKVAAAINQAFEVLDRKHENSVTLQLLTKSYNPQNHPHALSRRKSLEDIQAEFVNAISRKADQSGRVSQKAFVDYYSELNFCIPNERQTYFEQLIIGTWNLQKPEDYVCEKRLREIELTLYQKIRLKSDGKTNEWKTGKKALSYFDLGDTRSANYEGFKRGLDKFGCNFKENEMRVLFEKYAENDTLDYENFVKQIMEIDINGMISQPNLFQTKMGTNHFTVTH